MKTWSGFLPLLILTSPALAAPENLSLKQALDLAYKQNLDLVLAGQSLEQDTITFRNAWRTFFLPNISLTTSTTSAYTVGAYPGTPATTTLPAGRNTGYPTSSLSLNLASYTLFNFHRDRIAYDNSRLTFQRAGQVLEETRRSITFRVIAAYLQARLNQEKLDAAERSAKLAQTIVRLIKSRVSIGKATPTELSSVEVDANASTLQVSSFKADFESALLSLNAILNLPSETRFHLTSELKHTPSKLDFPQAYSWFKDHAPSIRGGKLAQQVSQGNVEIAEKNRMPLPTLSFSGVTISYGNTHIGSGNPTYSNPSYAGTPGSIELEASLNLTLPILGPGGFFGEDTVRSARIQASQAETRLQQALINGELQIRSSIFQLQQLEDRLKTLKDSYLSSGTLLEKIFSEATDHGVNRLELRDAIERARSNELDYLQNIYQYVTLKNTLFELIGKDWEE